MAMITLYQGRGHLDGSLKKPVMSFIEKIQEDPTSPGLNLKRPEGALDEKVRVARVNDQFRAVVFQLTGGKDAHFVYYGTFNHDEAYDIASRLTYRLNPVNSLTEIVKHPPANAEPAPGGEPRPTDQGATSPGSPAAAEQPTASSEGASPRPGAGPAAAAAPGHAKEKSSAEELRSRGIERSDLTDRLGFSSEGADIVFSGRTPDEALAALEESRPDWEIDAYLALAQGLSIEETIAEAGLDSGFEPDRSASEAEQISESLKNHPGNNRFVLVEGHDALRRALDSMSFKEGRVFLTPPQRAIVERDYSGSGRVFGGAGTGKTVVALHRARRLAQDNPDAAILLTTFTRSLAKSLKEQMDELYPERHKPREPGEPGIFICGVDQLAYAVPQRATAAERSAAAQQVLGRATDATPAASSSITELWAQALTLTAPELDGELKNPHFLDQEFTQVVLANRVAEQRGYLKVSRRGRGVALSRKQRKEVWKVIDTFRNLCRQNNAVSYPTKAALAAEILRVKDEDLFDHVVVDEAQDFHAAHWLMLRAAVPEGPNDIFLAEDSHQRIYGQRLVLGRFGITTRGRASTRLTLNYRTTAEILDYATRILEGDDWVDAEGEEDSVAGYRSARRGPKPVVRDGLGSLAGQVDVAAEKIRGWLADSPNAVIGVLTRAKDSRRSIAALLQDRGVPASVSADGVTRRTRRAIGADPAAEPEESASVIVSTMHSAKGLEFEKVVLIGMDDDSVPWVSRGIPEDEREDARQRERALLYVAASRARDELLITAAKPLSEMLPQKAA